MEKLNVALLNDSFPPKIDGVANATFNYASIIQQDFGNAYVATPKYPGIIDDYPFEVYRYTSLDTSKMIEGYRAGLPVSLNFLSQFNDKHIDIVHSHCPVSSNVLARILRHSLHVPVVMTYHTKFDYDIRHATRNRFIVDSAIKLLVANISCVDEVWTVSHGAGENLKSLGYEGDYLIMPNGVDFEKGRSPQAEINQVCQQYGIRTDKLTYLFVGRMMWYKGLRLLCDALQQTAQQGIDFQMVFVGGGDDRDEIMAYSQQIGIADRCIFTGPITERRKLKAIFSASDLFLFPSTYDTNGIVVREAAAAGLASVLVEGSCAAEDTEPNVNCLWIEENADSLARLLIQNGTHRDYYRQLGQVAQDQLYLSWQQAIGMAVERYKEILDGFNYKEDHLRVRGLTESSLALLGMLSKAVSSSRDFTQSLVQPGANMFVDFMDDIKSTSTLVNLRRQEAEDYRQQIMNQYSEED